MQTISEEKENTHVLSQEKFLSGDNFGAEHEKQGKEGKKRRKLFRSAKEKQG